MAHIDQDKKAKIREELKKVIPKTWKWSLSIRHHSALVLTVAKADVDVVKMTNEHNKKFAERRGEEVRDAGTHIDINRHYYSQWYEEYPEFVKQLDAIFKAIMTAGEWFDKSDTMTDYFHTAFYIDVQFGKWGKPYVYEA